MPTRAGHARWIMHIANKPRADHRRLRPRRQRGVLSRRSGGQRHRGLQRPAARALAARRRPDHDADQAARHRGRSCATSIRRAAYDRGAGGAAHRPRPSARRQCREGRAILSRRARPRPDARGAAARPSCRRAAITTTSAPTSGTATARDSDATDRAGLAWFSMEAADDQALDQVRQRLKAPMPPSPKSRTASRPPTPGAPASAS